MFWISFQFEDRFSTSMGLTTNGIAVTDALNYVNGKTEMLSLAPESETIAPALCLKSQKVNISYHTHKTALRRRHCLFKTMTN
jgi:hypothetical protein